MRRPRRAAPWGAVLIAACCATCGDDDGAPARPDADTDSRAMDADEPVDAGAPDAEEPLDSGAPDARRPDAGRPPVPPIDWSEIVAFHEAMRGYASAFAVEGGHWAEELGDAAFYGPAFYVRTGNAEGDTEALSLAAAARDYDLTLVTQATADLDFYTANMEEVFMAALGVLEHADELGDGVGLPEIDALLERTNDFLGLFRDYLNPDGELGAFALDTYGPTTITAAVALVNLQRARLAEGAARDAMIGRTREIVAAIDRNAWLEEPGYYRFAPDEDRVDLYPNVMMTLVLGRMHELTGEEQWLARAERMFDAIQPLRQPAGNYYSEYSAAAMGATTTDYSTLSSQNYLSLSLLILFERTRDPRYLLELKSVLDFIRTHLLDEAQGRLLHHWIDGRIALPEDLEYFCAGCNLQLLYVGWYLRARVLPTLESP